MAHASPVTDVSPWELSATRRKPVVVAAGLLAVALVVPARATDQTVSAKRLSAKQTGTSTSLKFLTTDTNILVPTPGGPDDPRTTGLTIAFAADNGVTGDLAVPPGDSGWSVRSGAVAAYKYRSPQPGTLRLAILQGRKLQVAGKIANLPLVTPEGTVHVTVRFGTLRNCAAFVTPRVDVSGRFEARNAPAPAACPTTTTTTLPGCSGENGMCLFGAGCCEGLECSSAGGPVGLGRCVGSCPSRLHAICAGNYPGTTAVSCCPGQECVYTVVGQFFQGTCETSGANGQCCQIGTTCNDMPPLVSCISPMQAGPAGTVCDGTTGTCSAAHTGDTGCCDLGDPSPSQPQHCVEGPGAADLCAALPHTTFYAGYHCSLGCIAP